MNSVAGRAVSLQASRNGRKSFADDADAARHLRAMWRRGETSGNTGPGGEIRISP